MTRIDRRAVLAGLAAWPLSARADAPRFAAAAERAAGLGQLHALAIAEGGETVFSRAFRGPAASRPVNVKSVSKTVVALLMGIAIDRGALPGPDATLGEVAPGLVPARAEPEVAGITLGHLASMTAG